MLLTPCKMLITAIFLSSLLCLACAEHLSAGGGNDDFIDHAGLSGTEHNRPKDDDEFFESNSGMPNLPFVTGVSGTHGTYRFLTVVEQTAILVGEPKHGMWRVQDKGVIREYRKKGKIGVRPGADYRSADLQDIVRQNYASYIPEESWSGYKYPDEENSKEGYLNFIDLSIYHPKYEGKYDDHEVIDLPYFYCTMTQGNYPHVWNAWKFATAQPMANKLGPLAKRAGMDIGENFLNLVRFDLFPDAHIWANIGLGNNATDLKVKNLEELKTRVAQTINYQRVDLQKMDYEIYLFERSFFNVPYLFISIVMESKEKPTWSYVRNDGPYWNDLVAKGKSSGYTSELDDVTHRLNFPKVEIEGYTNDTENRIHGLPVYGHHHPDRLDFKLKGGSCPERGGDWARYPWSNSGSGWPNQYQEVGPICDGIVLDIKVWANLWSDWDDDHIGLGNGAFDGLIVNYTMDANVYGHYTDPYLLEKNATNPYAIALTEDGKIVMPADAKPDPVVFQLNFTREGTYFDYNNATDLRVPEEPKPCPAVDKPKPCPDTKDEEDEVVPGWVISQLVQLAVLPGFFLVLPLL